MKLFWVIPILLPPRAVYACDFYGLCCGVIVYCSKLVYWRVPVPLVKRFLRYSDCSNPCCIRFKTCSFFKLFQMSSGFFTLIPIFLSLGWTDADFRAYSCWVETLWVLRGSNLCLLSGPVIPTLEPWLAWENIRDGVGLLARCSLWERI